MKATCISYSRVFTLGNYENEKISIEVELEDGDKAADALDKARKWVNMRSLGKAIINEYDSAKRIVDNPDEYTGRMVREAQEKLEKLGFMQEKDDLPF